MVKPFSYLRSVLELTIYVFIFLQVLPGLYVGNYRDSKDQQQLERHSITHIVAIHDSPRRLLAVIEILLFYYFTQDFI